MSQPIGAAGKLWGAIGCLIILACLPGGPHPSRASAPQDAPREDQPQHAGQPQHGGRAPTAEEARVRAQLLHEVIHGSLQVMHRDFFREDEGLTLPSRSLEDVFAELADRWNVEIRWLVVDAEAMNVDHKPRDAFERQAVTKLAAGAREFEAVELGRFRYAATIRLASQCLKCHVPNRTSLEDRAAGLAISIPLQQSSPQEP